MSSRALVSAANHEPLPVLQIRKERAGAICRRGGSAYRRFGKRRSVQAEPTVAVLRTAKGTAASQINVAEGAFGWHFLDAITRCQEQAATSLWDGRRCRRPEIGDPPDRGGD